MSFDTHRIYDSVIISSGWTSQIVSATTISAGTFYGGSLSASFVGNQNVTDQEFKYLSGTTANTQVQLNNLPNKNESFILHQNSNFLTNERTLSANSGVNIIQTDKNVSFESYLSSLEFSSTSVTFNSSQTAITNWSPINFQSNDNVRSTHIIITGGPTSYPSIISGLVGGTEGRIVIITNLSSQLYIFENESTKCELNNRFKFKSGKAYLLGMSNQSIILIYNSNFWEQLNGKQYYTTFQDFNYGPRAFMSFRDPTSFSSSASSTGCPPFYFKHAGGARPTLTGFTDAKTCVRFGPSSRYGTGRVTVNKLSYVGTTLGRIKLEGTFTYSNLTLFNAPYLTNGYSLKQYNQTPTGLVGNTGDNFMRWYPVSSGYWVNDVGVAGANQTLTQVSIQDTIDNFITIGMHLPSKTATNNTIYSFFYSYNENEYQWSNLLSLNVNANTGGQISIGIQGTTSVPGLFCDYIGVINPSIYY